MATKIIIEDEMRDWISELLNFVSKADETIIEKENKPFTILISIHGMSAKRTPGLNRGEIWVGEIFDEPLHGEFCLAQK